MTGCSIFQQQPICFALRGPMSFLRQKNANRNTGHAKRSTSQSNLELNFSETSRFALGSRPANVLETLRQKDGEQGSNDSYAEFASVNTGRFGGHVQNIKSLLSQNKALLVIVWSAGIMTVDGCNI